MPGNTGRLLFTAAGSVEYPGDNPFESVCLYVH